VHDLDGNEDAPEVLRSKRSTKVIVGTPASGDRADQGRKMTAGIQDSGGNISQAENDQGRYPVEVN